MNFNHTKLCAIDPIIFCCLNGIILSRHIGTKNIKHSSVSNCLLSTWLLLAVLNPRQIAGRISKEKYQYNENEDTFFCWLHANTHWNLQYKNLYSHTFWLIVKFPDLFESFHNCENHHVMSVWYFTENQHYEYLFETPKRCSSGWINFMLGIRTKDWLINQVNDFGLLWYASLFLVATP